MERVNNICLSCRRQPSIVVKLPQVEPYSTEIPEYPKKLDVYPLHDDYRCVWCGNQWNEREREARVRRG